MDQKKLELFLEKRIGQEEKWSFESEFLVGE